MQPEILSSVVNFQAHAVVCKDKSKISTKDIYIRVYPPPELLKVNSSILYLYMWHPKSLFFVKYWFIYLFLRIHIYGKLYGKIVCFVLCFYL